MIFRLNLLHVNGLCRHYRANFITHVDDSAYVLSATMENKTCFDEVIDMGTSIAFSVN